MNLRLKWKLIRKDYNFINEIILSTPEEILGLNSFEQLSIINYLVSTSNIESLGILFRITDYYTFRKMIIDQVKGSRDYHLLDKLIIECLSEFIDYATKANDSKLLLYLANFIENNKIVNLEYTESIKNHILMHVLNENVIRIACLPSFKDARLEDKIAKSKQHNYILSYVLNSTKNSKFLKKYLLSKSNYTDFKCFAEELKFKKPEAFKNLERITLQLVKERKIYPEYLMTVIELDPDNKNKDKYLKTLITISDYCTVKRLMKILTEEEQEKLCSWTLQENNTKTILMLAGTTNCSKTKTLINYILNFRTHINKAYLISLLEGEYLDYTLSKILIEQGTIVYIEIYNFLKDSKNIAYISMLYYVYNNNLIDLFPIHTRTILSTHKYLYEMDQAYAKDRELK